jgi:hypothetical protein
MNDAQIFEVVKLALASAREKYPDWPVDIVHAAAVVAEESGELVQAALDWHYKGARIERTFEEAIHTIVTAVRFLSEGETIPKQYSFPSEITPPPPAEGPKP